MNRWANNNFFLALCLTLVSLLSNPLAISTFVLANEYQLLETEGEPPVEGSAAENETPVRRHRKCSLLSSYKLAPLYSRIAVGDFISSLKGRQVVPTSQIEGKDVLSSPSLVPLRC